MEERDPAVLAQFVRLRVIDPEGAYWRRGIEAATRWLRETGSTELRVPYTFVTPKGWPTGIGAHPLGVWVADQRRYYAAGTLEPERVTELEALGMVWSVQETAWAEGLAVARAYAAAHGGMLLPPATAVWDGYPIGTWAKNQRAAVRRMRENARGGRDGHLLCRRTLAGPSGGAGGHRPGMVPPRVGRRLAALLPARPRAREGQRNAAGGPRPQVIVQGEDLGAWAAAQRHGWDKLLPAQQWLLESTLGLKPADEDERLARRSQSAAWERNIAAARQFHAREGHQRVPRQHVEAVDGTSVRLGQFVGNARRRATRLSEQRRADLDALDMRW
ncbi:Helicase associated domain protein [Streptomyces sp. NPDC004721]